MAAITYWVDPVSGNDANSGTSFGDAIETFNQAGALIAAAGDGNDFTINMTNTGTHTITGTPLQRSGQSTSTILIRGTDSSGNPALTNVNPSSTTSVMFNFEDFASITAEYMDINLESRPGAMAVLNIGESTPSGILRYCKITYSDIGQPQDTSTKRIVDVSFDTPFNDVSVEIYGSYFVNWRGQLFDVNHNTNISTEMHHCVLYNEHEAGVGPIVGSTWSANESVSVHHCTQYSQTTTGVSGGATNTGFISNLASSGDAGTVTFQDNLMWRDVGGSFSATSAGEFASATSGSSATFTSATISNNVFVTGPNLTSLGTPGDLVNYEDLPWDPGVDDLYSGDVRDDNVADTSVFNDPSGTYDWTPDGSALAITVVDLRPAAYTTASSTGGLVGALPPATTDYTVTVSTDRTSYKQGYFVGLTVTVSNAGVDATGVTVAVSVPSELTDLGISTVTAGSYGGGSGTWTVGNLGNGSTETLTAAFSVGTSVPAGDLTFSATLTGGSPGAGGDTSDDSDTAVITILVPPPSSGDPEEPAARPFLDVIPVNAELWEMDLNVAFQTKRNRLRRHYMRSDEEGEYIRELSIRRLTVGTNTSTQVILGGIEIGQNLILESDTQVDVSVGNSTGLWVAGKVFVLSGGDFEQVHIRNQSTTVDATVHYGVTD